MQIKVAPWPCGWLSTKGANPEGIGEANSPEHGQPMLAQPVRQGQVPVGFRGDLLVTFVWQTKVTEKNLESCYDFDLDTSCYPAIMRQNFFWAASTYDRIW